MLRSEVVRLPLRCLADWYAGTQTETTPVTVCSGARLMCPVSFESVIFIDYSRREHSICEDQTSKHCGVAQQNSFALHVY
ncbi:hypothetical protein F2P81_019492 [Scophthalmus maximus]|uniref:Uncharacterized protein n=1 Tax=Scophthalmus maximus TaxID=52904 RepID=A0A6A4S7Y9_SCOMX|nr:hypothetical protein F2P81_019492 [Scophthalmus maximus]